MSLAAHAFEWRAPRAGDWEARVDALLSLAKAPALRGDVTAIAQAARTLARQRLDDLAFVKINRLAARLWPHRAQLPSFRCVRLAVLGNRTLSYLSGALRGAALARGLLLDVVEGEFDSVAAIAGGRVKLETSGAIDACLLVLDEAAFGLSNAPLERIAEQEAMQGARAMLGSWVEGLRTRFNAPVIVATVALKPEAMIASAERTIAGSTARFVAGLNDAIHAGGERGDWIVWDLAALANEVGTQAWFDPARLHEAKLPFALAWCPLAADHLSRVLAAMNGKSGRVLVLDLDNTLWGGVIGDDGVGGIRIGQGSAEGEAFLAVQRLALQLRARGVVLAVCSKNDARIAREPFTDHPDMLLKLDDFAVFQANWADKSANVRAVAQALDLGLESLVFVDDNPAERARVRQELPDVIVPELGDDPALFPRLIVASGAFEHLALTGEDLARAQAYKANQSRAVQRASAENYDTYLRSLDMRMQIAPFDKLGRARIAQLINKSNQFNLTTRRYSEIEVAAFESSSALAWQVRLADSFGDHGMIGVVIVRREGQRRWEIDTWLMSCRVLERGVEQSLMNELVKVARAGGCNSIAGTYIATDRNGLVADFFERMQFSPLPEPGEGGGKRYGLDVAVYVPFPSFIAISDAGEAMAAID